MKHETQSVPETSAPVDSDQPISDAEMALAKELYANGSESTREWWENHTTSLTKAQYVIAARELLERLKKDGFMLSRIKTRKKARR
jgi:hypothetical protein